MYYEGLGRRKTASARVRLHAGGSGQYVVNGQPYREYFRREVDWQNVVMPLQLTQTEGQFDITVLVEGGGITGQSEAVRMGISRALLNVDPEFRTVLRNAGFLTRDAREKERKKPGLKRARKAPQYTKR
ncbi:MAG TPA: 30S ribosomal protein S9 [Anaerolineae bacterium]|nr:30S ribosomal protein S9 [Anaerolineae bacterium]HQH37548.1 30S ribosomal protein S9 [Anaerolineae bacterium]